MLLASGEEISALRDQTFEWRFPRDESMTETIRGVGFGAGVYGEERDVGCEATWQAAWGMVAVGLAVARHPPHRSVHEELPHTAPASGNDAKAH